MEFIVNAGHDQWDRHLGGWRCDALKLPGSDVVALYHDAQQVDSRLYRRDGEMVLWSGTAKSPGQVALKIAVKDELIRLDRDKKIAEEQKNQLEKDKLELERQKIEIDRRWRKYTALVSVVTALIGAAATLAVASLKGGGAPAGGGISRCRDSLDRLEELGRLSGQSVENLESAIARHVSVCQGLVASDVK
ncbi:hypothetical protein [Corallococcus sp. CA049B]|uniref:hypothetical protein n=1 Tax=Corallococcus sp. CA049B TaxID=2316730 RepID=UPI0011C3D96E|nr:hypothetical protein [Corallococcus sp. CA049B]